MFSPKGKICGGAALLLLACVSSSHAAVSYSGSISWDAAETKLAATNDWENTATTLAWTITDNAILNPLDPLYRTYHYEYTFTTASKNLSHIIFELSSNVALSDILNEEVNGADWSSKISIQDFDSSNGNPLIPGTLHGVKFNETTGISNIISFDLNRLPVWGDFYAKDGGGNSTGAVTAVNAGFLAADPLSAAANGPLSGHILVPDTLVPPPPTGAEGVPEPTSIVVWSVLSLIGLAMGWRRSRAH